MSGEILSLLIFTCVALLCTAAVFGTDMFFLVVGPPALGRLSSKPAWK